MNADLPSGSLNTKTFNKKSTIDPKKGIFLTIGLIIFLAAFSVPETALSPAFPAVVAPFAAPFAAAETALVVVVATLLAGFTIFFVRDLDALVATLVAGFTIFLVIAFVAF